MVEEKKKANNVKNRVLLTEMSPAVRPSAPEIIYTIVDLESTTTILKLISFNYPHLIRKLVSYHHSHNLLNFHLFLV